MGTQRLSERFRHATIYNRHKDVLDRQGRNIIGERGLFYRSYRCLRVYAKSGLPIDKDWHNEAAYTVLLSRGLITETQTTLQN
jgi:hypothetical protein